MAGDEHDRPYGSLMNRIPAGDPTAQIAAHPLDESAGKLADIDAPHAAK